MKNILTLLKSNYETLLYVAAIVLLALALIKPEIQMKQAVHNYLLVADVTQSMNAEDEKLKNQPVSRLAYTRHLMKKIVEANALPDYDLSFVSTGDNSTAVHFVRRGAAERAQLMADLEAESARRERILKEDARAAEVDARMDRRRDGDSGDW